jgi:hypothetical protein
MFISGFFAVFRVFVWLLLDKSARRAFDAENAADNDIYSNY